MQKTKPQALRTSIPKSTSIEIRAKANMLPIKSLIYALSHVIADPSVQSDARNDGIGRRVQMLSRHVSNLGRIANVLSRSGIVRPEMLYRTISSATTSYVNLFYAMKHGCRSSFIERCYTDGTCGRVRPDSNILVMPALMATRKEKRNKVSSNIIRHLYSMPMKVVYRSSKSAMHVELLEQALSVKSISDSALRRFSASLKKMDALIGAIEAGAIDPGSDEQLKELFIDEIVELSLSEDIRLAEYVSEKLSTNSVNYKVARRIMRK